MKKGMAVFLLGLYLCVSTEGYQLLKIPALITHFITHCQQEPGTTLKSFLAEHYSSDVVYDDDWQQDMQLPFKTCESPQLSIPATLHPESVVLPLPHLTEVFISFTPRIEYLNSKNQATKIFQPPRNFA